MRLAAYIRVSTKGQAEDGTGLDVQRDHIERWAARHGHTLVQPPFADEGVSGTKPAYDRDGLTAALNAVVSGEAEGIVAANTSRYARALDVQEAVYAHVWRHGGKVFSVEQTEHNGEILADDPDDPMRTTIRQIMGAFAELDRKMTVKRLRDARELKRRSGGKAVGAYPFGLSKEGPVKREQDVLSVIREQRTTHAAWSTIAADLNSRGAEYAPRRAQQWSAVGVATAAQRAGIQ